MSRARKKSDGPGAVALVEEAVHLARSAPAAAWAIYFSGTVPWVLGLGYFWATTSWFAARPEEILWRAMGLTALYLWLKVAQAEFCGRLRAMRFGVTAPALSGRALWRTGLRQAHVQGWAVPLMPVAAVLAFPVGFVWTYFENVTALASSPDANGESLSQRARREAMRWPGPAHVALLLFSGVWLCAWLNVASAFYAVPWLARTLLGMENIFGLSGWSAMNSTLLALVTILTWLAVDPLVKAYHVLRTFYGEARHTGEDLRLELRRPAPRGALAKASRMALWILGIGLLAGAGPTGVSVQAAEATAQVSPLQVDQALDEALRDRDFRWSLQPLPTIDDVSESDGWLKGFVRQGFQIIGEMIDGVRTFFKNISDWVEGLFKNNKDKPKPEPRSTTSMPDFGAVARGLLYVLLGLCLLALLWILWTSWRKRPVAPRALMPLTA
ncbi:MAG: hypothetical protein ABW223_04850, partial [Rariglobus sp.]